MMSFWDGMTRNWADLSPGSPDPLLRPIELDRPPKEAVAWAAAIIATWPRWDVVASDPETGRLHVTHKTLVWRFVDDVRLQFEPEGDGCRVVGQSRSRIGKGDLGQNARNLHELRRRLLDAVRGG